MTNPEGTRFDRIAYAPTPDEIKLAEKLKIAIDSATDIIFLNQIWLAQCREMLENAIYDAFPGQGMELTGTQKSFFDHAKKENQKAFQRLIDLEK